uniref:Guanylate cyclase domain-containing protein n=1 Tax=Acrobeloides nanus TaxID=290746 RepID=A0A914CEP0_9BILA
MIVEQRLHQTTEIAEAFPEATCMISSIAFFEVILNNCNAKEIFTLVTNLFYVYDRLIDLHKCHKVASIKDAYFVVAGIKDKSDHASRILNLAIGFLHESKQIIIPQINMPVVLRIAIHTGPVVAGLVGKTTVRYTIVGEGFDFANQLIQLEEIPGQIILTSATRNCVKKSEKDSFVFINNGYKQVRKNQATCTFRLEKNQKKSVWDIIGREPDPLKSVDGYKELFENDLNKWLDLERDLQRQLVVIALMRNKPIPSSTVAYKRLRWAQLSRNKRSFKSGDSGDLKGSRDSGVSLASSNSSIRTKSSLCEIM